MRRMQSYANAISLYLILSILGTMIVHGDPEPMARPTRPEVIASPEELRRYLDYVRDYYSLNGKARYGKRGEVISPMMDANRAWDTMKSILGVPQQSQQHGFEKRTQEKSRFLRELDNSDDNKHAPRIDARRCRLRDTVDKYYDDMQ